MLYIYIYIYIYICSVRHADLSEDGILDSITLLSWFIHRFWKFLVRHIFSASKIIAGTNPQLIPKMSETLPYNYDPNWFPQNFKIITEVLSETIQKLSINHNNIEIRNYNAENQLFTCTNISENTNTSLEASPMENLDTIVHSQPTDIYINETIETDFNATLLVDGTLFSLHTVKTLINLEDHGQNITRNKNNNYNIADETTNNTNIYHNHQQRQPVNSTELTQNSYPLNATLPTLPNVNTPLQRLRRQNLLHFNTEHLILNNSTQPTLSNNQNIRITPQQLVNFVRQFNS